MNWHGEWAPYVPVAERQRRGLAKAKKRLRKGEELSPLKIATRKMATTFWGQGWCDHFEQRSDFANRLPRGKTYARNGSIAHLRIESGTIDALVCGSELYSVTVKIKKLPTPAWKKLCKSCATSIHSVIDLMLGKLPESVLEQLTDPSTGIFPSPREMTLSCDCPDGARLCKHLAAVLYGVGSRLDDSPELLFLLRGVDQQDLIGQTISDHSLQSTSSPQASIDSSELEDIFGIDLAPAEPVATQANPTRKKATRKKVTKKKATAKKKSATKKTAVKKKTPTKKAKKKATKKAKRQPK